MAGTLLPVQRQPRTILRKAIRGALLALAIVTALAAGTVAWVWVRLEPLSLARAEALSVTVVDRNDRLLRAYAASDDIWRLPVEVADVDPRYLAMLIAFEDKRFREHPGVDVLAVLRAGWQLVRHRRIVSGASTLTMQVARLLLGRHERSLWGKIEQMLLALSLERRFSKDEILRLYLRLAPFGGNLEGVRAASLAYFGKEPRRLSIAEAALLVAIPQSPQMRRPDRNPGAARRARDHVLRRMLAAGVVKRADAERAMAGRLRPVELARREFPMLAPHLADTEVARHPGRLVHRLTLDRQAQTRLEDLVRDYVSGLEKRMSAAVVAADHRTGEIVAYVGSPGLLDLERFGAIDMAAALRSPGSTLKPIIYGLAFELGLAHPSTLIEDAPARFGVYTPKNFDNDWHGTVTIRAALIHSLNVPAVKVLEAVGAGRLYSRLRQAGVDPVLPKGANPSLAMALGGVGLRLIDLAQLYAAIARGGEAVALHHSRDRTTPSEEAAPARRLLSEVAAWYVRDILCRALPPANAKPGLICYKTGTSYGYRDAWSVGFDGRHVVAVWVGRADSAAVPGLTGRTSAAPLLFDAFARLAVKRTPLPPAPAGVIRARTAELPPPLRHFRGGGAGQDGSAGDPLDPGVRIAFPPDRAEIEVGDEDDDRVVVRAEGGTLPLTWLLNGAPLASDPARRDAELPAGRRGFFRLTVVDAKGRSDRVAIRLK